MLVVPLPMGKDLFHLRRRGRFILGAIKVLIELYEDHVDAAIAHCEQTDIVDVIQGWYPRFTRVGPDGEEWEMDGSIFDESTEDGQPRPINVSLENEEGINVSMSNVSSQYLDPSTSRATTFTDTSFDVYSESTDPNDSPHRHDGTGESFLDNEMNESSISSGSTIAFRETVYQQCSRFEVQFGGFREGPDSPDPPRFGELPYLDKVALIKAMNGNKHRFVSASMNLIRDAFLDEAGKPTKAYVTIRFDLDDDEYFTVDRHIHEIVKNGYHRNDLIRSVVLDWVDHDVEDPDRVFPRNIVGVM